MKKMIAVLLVLMMVLTCLTAGAEETPAETVEATATAAAATVNMELSVDKELVSNMILSAGMPEEQAGLIDPIIDLLNVLKIKVISADGGAQIDLDVNETTAVSLGMAASEDGIQIASSLIPNYLLTVPAEMIQNIMQQYMPGAGAGNVDMAAVGEAVMGYVNTFMESVQTAVKPGEPEQGTFEFEGIAFDTRTPVDLDMKIIADAVKKLVSDLMNDEKVSGVIKQTTPDFDPAETMKNLEEALAEERLPEVKTDMYSSSENMGVVYIMAEVKNKDAEAAAETVTMLIDQVAGSVQMKMTNVETGAVLGLNGSQEGALIYAEQGEQYFALSLTMGENEALRLDLFAGVKERPVVTLTVSMATDGERTLSMDPEGKTVLSLAELQSEDAQQAMMGLQQALMANVGQLMQIPEVASVMAAYSQMMQMQQMQQMQQETVTEEEPAA